MGEWHLDVDGHRFLVRERADEPGVHDVRWLTGPHPYGFTSASSDRSAMTLPRMREAIIGFLAQVDPDTGHIE